MTVADLYNSVARLGFEDSLEDDSSFFFAANRALLQVNSLRPATSAYTINHRPMENKVKEDTFSPITKVEDLYFEAVNVKSYYFETDGIGTVYIEKYDEASGTWLIIDVVSINSNKGFTAFKGFIKQDAVFVKGMVRLHFTGEYLYSVKNIAMYEHLYSSMIEDIPAYEPYTKYDISLLVPDFLSLHAAPIKEPEGYMYLNQDYSVENGRIILFPYNAGGIYKIVYKRKPKAIVNTGEVSEDYTQIDLDEDLCALLPTLIASYIWVDDEPEKAQYYLALYQDRATDIESRFRSAAPVAIKNSNGW